MHVPCIAELEPAGPKRRARRIRFHDSESITTTAGIVRALDLAPGQPVLLEDLRMRIAELEPAYAHERALWLLGYRDRSRTELRQELLADGFSESVVSPVVSRLEQLSLIDDRRFAFAFARSRASAGRGSRVIERELLGRGVDPDIARAATAEAIGDDEVSLARAVIGTTPITGHADRERMLHRLIRRGFGMAVALEAISAITAE